MSYTVRKDQSLIDIAVTNYGSKWIDGLLQIIEHNEGVSLATTLVPGTELVIKNVDENDLSLQYLKARNITVATGNYTLPVPATPTGILAVIFSDSENLITWTDNSNDEMGFEIWKAETEDGEYELIATTDENTEEYLDNDV